MEGLTREQLLLYLDRVHRLYPGGVPRELVVTPERHADTSSAVPKIGYVVPAPGALPESLVTLLKTITEKGLSLDESDSVVRSCDVADRSALLAAIGELATSVSPAVIVVLGSTAEPPGTWRSEGAVPVLHTHSLGEIEANKTVKREFWGHLQAVIAKIPR